MRGDGLALANLNACAGIRFPICRPGSKGGLVGAGTTAHIGAMTLRFDNSWLRDLPGTYLPARPAIAPAPRLVAFNGDLARALGLDLTEPQAAAWFSGAEVPPGAEPVALAYAGHQFGGFSAQLGDGRAHLLGEFLGPDGRRWDLQLKGSGRTAFSRGGDGKASVGPMLREYLISEAMAALGIPTTRALAVVATGEEVWREAGALPGAVLARVAASHIRVGSFEFFSARGETDKVRALMDYTIQRHYPGAVRRRWSSLTPWRHGRRHWWRSGWGSALSTG